MLQKAMDLEEDQVWNESDRYHYMFTYIGVERAYLSGLGGIGIVGFYLLGFHSAIKSTIFEILGYITLYACCYIGNLGFDKFFANDVFVQLYIAIGNAIAIFGSHLRNGLSLFALESIGNEPLTNKLLRELTLVFAFGQTLFIAFGLIYILYHSLQKPLQQIPKLQ